MENETVQMWVQRVHIFVIESQCVDEEKESTEKSKSERVVFPL